MGRFVEIHVDASRVRAERAAAVVRVCPVDIFVHDAGGELRTRPEREDECILCGRCLEIADDGLSVTRAYGARRPVSASERGG